MRRFTRLTNAFSKKVQNHIYALALYFVCTTSAGFTKVYGAGPGAGGWTGLLSPRYALGR